MCAVKGRTYVVKLVDLVQLQVVRRLRMPSLLRRRYMQSCRISQRPCSALRNICGLRSWREAESPCDGEARSRSLSSYDRGIGAGAEKLNCALRSHSDAQIMQINLKALNTKSRSQTEGSKVYSVWKAEAFSHVVPGGERWRI